MRQKTPSLVTFPPAHLLLSTLLSPSTLSSIPLWTVVAVRWQFHLAWLDTRSVLLLHPLLQRNTVCTRGTMTNLSSGTTSAPNAPGSSASWRTTPTTSRCTSYSCACCAARPSHRRATCTDTCASTPASSHFSVKSVARPSPKSVLCWIT